LLALLQFSGARFDNPLINEVIGKTSGSFANRNHFAMFMALGCLIAPIWAFTSGGSPGWRGPVAVGSLLFFTLTILASGSRVGLLTGPLGVVIGLGLARSGIRRALSRHPHWVTWGLIAGVIAAISAAVLLSVVVGRAMSIDRALALDEGQDLRFRGLPTVLEMTRAYFPFGSGIGAFEGVFRMHEPLDLLAPTYFNHAHNDWLEVVLDAGLPGALFLLAAVGWWTWASVQAWWISRGRDPMPRLGSAMLLLIMISSVFDYPVRTPMIMAMIVIAGIWLGNRAEPPVSSALRTSKPHL
jgi:O-antigen ligase